MAFLAALLFKPSGPKAPTIKVPPAPAVPPPAAAPPPPATIEEQATLGEADVRARERRRRGQKESVVSDPSTLGLNTQVPIKSLLGG